LNENKFVFQDERV